MPSPQESLRYSRTRDQQILWLLQNHPITARELVSLGWFPQVAKARKRLRRLAMRRKILCVGSVQRKLGRPELVYSKTRIKSDDLLHEVELSELCLRLNVDQIERGSEIQRSYYRPDAQLTLSGKVLYLEYDRGTMSAKQLEQRFQKYRDCQTFCLWVCQTPSRVELLRKLATPIRISGLFTTKAELMHDPHGRIWIDSEGNRASLPQSGS